MNPLLEYKRIKQAVLNKNKFSVTTNTLKETKEKHEHERDEKRQWHNRRESKDVPRELAVINERKMNRLLSNLHNETKYQSKDESKMKDNWKRAEENKEKRKEKEKDKEQDEMNSEHFLEEATKKKKRIHEYEYCYICETPKPCDCDENEEYEQKEDNWRTPKLYKANIHSNLNDISKLMRNIQDSKKKTEMLTNKNESGPLEKNQLNKKEIKKKDGNKTMSYYEQFHQKQLRIIKQKLENRKNGSEGTNLIGDIFLSIIFKRC